MSAIDERMFVISNNEDLKMFHDQFGENLIDSLDSLGWYFWNGEYNIEGPFKTYEEANKAFEVWDGRSLNDEPG